MRHFFTFLVLTCCTFPAQAETSAPLALPFNEDFAKGEPEPGWTQVQTGGGQIVLQDDVLLHVRGSENGRAHIQSPLQADNVTATVKSHADGFVYLVWDENNWAGLGKVSPTPFGRLATSITRNGETTETQHRGIFFHSPHLLRVQLGADHLRFQYSNTDKVEWRHLLTIERNAEYAGVPKLVAFGRHYKAGEKPFATVANLEVTTTTRGKGIAPMDDVVIEETPAGDLTMTAEERRWLHEPKPEPVNDLLKQSDDDPTYEQVSAVYPAMKYPREVTGVPAQALDIGIDYLGRFDVSPWTPPLAWLEIGDQPKPLAKNPEEISSRQLVEGYIPIVTLKKEDNGTKYELTALGWSDGFSADTNLYAYARLNLQVNQGVHLPAKVSLVEEKTGKRVSWQPQGDSRDSADLYFKFKFPEPASAVQVEPEEYERVLAEATKHWKERLAAGTRFITPDKSVNDMYRALLAYSLLNTDKVNGRLEPHDGSGFYDSMFGQSVSLYAVACDMLGLHDYAAQIFDMQLHFQVKDGGENDGLYYQDCGLVDIGALLAGLARHYEMTGDKEWLKRVSPNIIKGAGWVTRQRATAAKEGKTQGLIKFRPYNDFPQPTYNYVGNVLCCVGLEECGKVLRDIGMDADAQKLAEEGARYRKDIYASMEAAKVQLNGTTMLPIEPDTQRLIKMSTPPGGEYYGLTSSQMLGTEFFRADDKQADLLINSLENLGGLIGGVCEFQEGIDHAYTYGYLKSQLERGHPRKTILGFWTMMAYGMTRGTYSPVEVTMLKTGENHYTLPHLYSCTDHLRIFRHMLLREDKDKLVLGQAIPREWLQPGKSTEVTNAPTVFGPVSYTMQAQQDGSVRVHVAPPTRKAVGEIELHVRHPSRRDIFTVETPNAIPIPDSVDGPDTGPFFRWEEQIVRIANLQKPIELVVRFREAQ